MVLSLTLWDPLSAQLLFSNVAGVGTDGSDIPYSKDGGCAFSDYDLDGDLDLVVNTFDGSSARRSYLLRNDDGVFVDVTMTVAPGLKADQETERVAAWGDANYDGYPDLMVNANNRLKILINNSGVSFTLHVNMSSIADGMNTEGAGWLDYDNDGDLDFFVENHNFGIDIFQNDGSVPLPGFTHVTQNSTGSSGSGAGGIGLPEGGSSAADYATSVDLNQDGYVDILARRRNDGIMSGLDQNSYDIFLNQGNGTFLPLTTFNEQADNGNKGSIVTGDFDNDGDFDLVWTSSSSDSDRLVLYENTGFNSMNFVLVPNCFLRDNGSLETGTSFDGAAIGDIDNDGDLDLFFTEDSGPSKLFLNNSTGPGSFAFRQPGPIWIPGSNINYGIDVAGDGEGCTMVDFDNDGDLDIYVNVNNGPNQFWQNPYIGSSEESNSVYQNNYIRIIAARDLGGGMTSPAVNATVNLLDCNGAPLGGVREVGAGGSAHGSQTSPWLHFGLPNGPDEPYLIEVRFTRTGMAPIVVTKAVVPSTIAPMSIGSSGLILEQTIVIRDTDVNDALACLDSDLDGIYDHADLDDDNDGVPDLSETGDADGDGVPDQLDLDSDNDGIFDCVESGVGAPQVNGVLSGPVNPNGIPTTADTNADGAIDYVLNDSDGDSLPDHLEQDSDDDGCSDVVEAGFIDVNGDGVPGDAPVTVDSNGLVTSLTP